MFVSRETLDELMATVPLEEVVVATGYGVRGTGRSKGIERCPKCGRDWTHIKINGRRNLFRCMSPSCGWAGNAFHWVMETRGCQFLEAVKYVATLGDFELPQSTKEEKQRLQRIQKCLQETVRFYGQFSHDYIAKRGITKETAEKYLVGFAPGGTVLKDHLNQLGFDDVFLEEIKLIRRVGDNLMDSFFNRVVVPIYLDNRIVDLYGRSIFDKGTKHFYLNGQKILMGYDEIVSGEPVLIVEGPFDWLSLKQNKVMNALCTGGASKFSSFHIHRLKKKGVPMVFIGYDTGDKNGSGQEGAIEAGILLQEAEIPSRVIQMPEDTDVNKLLRENSIEAYRNLIREALPFEKYHAFHTLSKIPTNLIHEYLNGLKVPH
ncbi:hypothetical protein ABE38_05585 [Brevibacillus agri]|nr:hypothetical protein [Brevibacillus agri]